MRRLDELHLDYPFAGARMLRALLRREGIRAGRRHVATLMKRMGISAIYRRPDTSKPAPGHKIHPYLLRGVKIERANHVWAMDITYIPMRRGFVYLAAVVDVASRRVLAHRVSITMEALFCIEAVEEALARHGRPEIFNTDQGSQFTSLEFTGVLMAAGVAISMDGKGAWRDNVFVERLCAPATAYRRRACRSADTWPSTIRGGRIRALTDARPTRPISPRKQWLWPHDRRRAILQQLWSGSALPTPLQNCKAPHSA